VAVSNRKHSLFLICEQHFDEQQLRADLAGTAFHSLKSVHLMIHAMCFAAL